MSVCTFPSCTTPPTTTNRAGQHTCTSHRAVVITGSWTGEGSHHRPEGTND
jgi:hypothetical protein